MKNILELAGTLKIPKDKLIPFGWDKAKISLDYLSSLPKNKNSKLVLVTAITPTKAGEGKTTTTISLHDGLRRLGMNSLAVLREPSLGPVFGIKGGAVGALKATIIPSDDINLHFTGDFHAITSTVNLISAIVENSIFQGNPLSIDPEKIVWPRAIDMNDRSLRNISIQSKSGTQSSNHNSSFVITVASELMAIFCLAEDEETFLDSVENIIVAYTFSDTPIKVKDLQIRGAIKKLMHTSLNPNLVQTLEENPVLVHGGPFANIAHGCNSVIATKAALKLADIVVTEAGFGSDLGAEKFFDIKCQRAGLKPDAVVLVATVRALKYHGGVAFTDLDKENIDALKMGLLNLQKHAENMVSYGVPIIITANRFPSDTDEELQVIAQWCTDHNYDFAINSGALYGSAGAEDLAKKVISCLETKQSHFKPLYNLYQTDLSITDKIDLICKKIYGANSVNYTELAKQQIKQYSDLGYDNLAICMAKTPNSLSDNPKLLNTPTNFCITIREVNLSAGAGFIIPITGKIVTMPGLPKDPLACHM